MKNKGFTLIELLAVIVILAVILVIAVPKITNTITDTKKASLLSSAKMIVRALEQYFTVNETLGNNPTAVVSYTTCPTTIASFNTSDYTCQYTITAGGVATVKLSGAANGKFDGLVICGVTSSSDGSYTCAS